MPGRDHIRKLITIARKRLGKPDEDDDSAEENDAVEALSVPTATVDVGLPGLLGNILGKLVISSDWSRNQFLVFFLPLRRFFLHVYLHTGTCLSNSILL